MNVMLDLISPNSFFMSRSNESRKPFSSCLMSRLSSSHSAASSLVILRRHTDANTSTAAAAAAATVIKNTEKQDKQPAVRSRWTTVRRSSSNHNCCCQCEALQLRVFFYKGDDDDVDSADELPGTPLMTCRGATHVESWELQLHALVSSFGQRRK